ncbi:hypothetical protein GTA08_BOTSDO01771 [Botryosphaeria dothidea]|uniref:Uncharacterized protein n=1 Tax=Botryosphaeria dothidea TaxID=55169 RepID=A0A8H4JAI2_9PEZI|nr:hypothetical protein GTA08_BOTSDO01771 [Botryosphaeria dothidea]
MTAAASTGTTTPASTRSTRHTTTPTALTGPLGDAIKTAFSISTNDGFNNFNSRRTSLEVAASSIMADNPIGSLSRNEKIAIGAAVPLGFLLFVGLVVGAILLFRRRRSKNAQQQSPGPLLKRPSESGESMGKEEQPFMAQHPCEDLLNKWVVCMGSEVHRRLA